MQPRPIIEAFDLHLHGLGLNFEGIVIGGAPLGLSKSKLFALCDRGTDLPDVRATFEDLARRLGHGV